jgi:hypothetical protein
VHLDIGTKKRVSELVEEFPLEMNGLTTLERLNIFPLDSYEDLIGMDWLASHNVKLYFYSKTFDCVEDDRNSKVLKGISKAISIRKKSALQLKKILIYGFQVYVSHLLEPVEKTSSKIKYYPILQEFKDVFPNEIPSLAPERDIDFSIDMMMRDTPISNSPYRMNTLEIIEMNMQL